MIHDERFEVSICVKTGFLLLRRRLLSIHTSDVGIEISCSNNEKILLERKLDSMMTNLLPEPTSHVIHELLDDIKENIIQINDHCRP